MKEIQRQLLQARNLDPDPGHGGRVTEELLRIGLYRIRGDLRGELVAWVRNLAAGGTLASPELGLPNFMQEYGPQSLWLWSQLDRKEAKALARFVSPDEMWIPEWTAHPGILAELGWGRTEQVWERIAGAGNAECEAAITQEMGGYGSGQVDWLALLERAVMAGNPWAVLHTLYWRIGTVVGTADVVNMPKLGDLYRGAAEVLALHWEETQNSCPDISFEVMETLGRVTWGEEAWQRYEAGQHPGTPSGDGTGLDSCGCVTETVAMAASQRPDEVKTDPRVVATIVTVASEEALVKLTEAEALGPKHYNDIVWRLTAAGRDSEWLWEQLPLRVLYSVAPHWVVQRLRHIELNDPRWDLLESWQGSGAQLDALG